jgi:hypothetical protein
MATFCAHNTKVQANVEKTAIICAILRQERVQTDLEPSCDREIFVQRLHDRCTGALLERSRRGIVLGDGSIESDA